MIKTEILVAIVALGTLGVTLVIVGLVKLATVVADRRRDGTR